MTAYAEITAAIDRHRAEREAVPLIGRHKTLVVEVGDSAAQGIVAETREPMPSHINGVPLVRTKEFRGWALVER